MEIPVIDFSEPNGEGRSKTMALLHQACEQWGFFQIDNHGIDKKLMDRVKQLVNSHYEENLKDGFYQSDIAKDLENKEDISNKDWETAFYVRHPPKSNIEDIPNISPHFCKSMNEYIAQLLNLAEKLSELMCENLGLENHYIKKAFSGSNGSPSNGRLK